MKELNWCTNCLNMSTRPRISFDERGWCNACRWMKEKETLNWDSRKKELIELLDQYRSKTGGFDCLVPCSGGKDGSSVAYKLKHKYNMNPLCVTITPALSLDIGDQNLKNFINTGYNHVQVSPDSEVMRKINKRGFIEMGFPYYGWLMAIFTSVFRVAMNFDIPLIFYGEDGEVEYGGSTETRNRALFDIEYMKRIYFEGGYEKVLQDQFTEKELYFWTLPSENEINNQSLSFTHWSYFEPWDSYQNYLLAKEHCGLQEQEASNVATYTNFAQNDQALYALHTYIMYLKFGFGRATQDVGIDIRRGALSREQGKQLVRIYDNHYPEDFLPLYLNYYKMTQKEFDNVLDKWVNKSFFLKEDGRWQPRFEVDKGIIK